MVEKKVEMKLPDTAPQHAAAPYVDPRLANSAAAQYQQQLAARRQAAQKEQRTPIPRLDARNFSEGMTMAQNAAQQALAEAGEFPMGPPPPPPMGAPPVKEKILPMDMLPNTAMADPQFQQGMGSMQAMGQPHLARKYGVVRNGQFIPPTALVDNDNKARFKPETLEAVKAVAEFNQQQAQQTESAADKQVEEDATKSASGAAARLGNAPGDTRTSPATAEDVEALAKKNLDDFDFDVFRQMMQRDLINNEEQRKIVEERCAKLNIEDAIINDYLEQRVPIIPGKFEPTFRTISAEEELALKRLLMLEAQKLKIQEHYLLDKYAVMTVVAGTVAINNMRLPEHTVVGANGIPVFDDERFWQKFNALARKPIFMMASLGVHFFWFDIRCRRLVVTEKVGNG